MKRIATALAAALVIGAFCASPANAAAVHYAYGSGEIAIPHEVVSFAAVQRGDGTATGFAVVRDISAGVNAFIRVDCLNVIGNLAVISGKVTSSSKPAQVPVGSEAVFQVIDNDAANGEENDQSADFMSPVNFYDVGVGPDCSVPLEDVEPIQKGDIEVR